MPAVSYTIRTFCSHTTRVFIRVLVVVSSMVNDAERDCSASSEVYCMNILQPYNSSIH